MVILLTAYMEKNTLKTLENSLSFNLTSLIFKKIPAPARLHCMDSTQYVSSYLYKTAIYSRCLEAVLSDTKGAGSVD